MSPWAYNQDVLLNRVEDKQSFKRLSVYISIKCRKLQCIKKLFNFLLQIAFLFDSSIHFICTLYFHTSTEYPFSFRGTSLWSSNSSFKATHPVVKMKRNKKIFCFILCSLISVGVLKIRCFDAQKKLLYFGSKKNYIPLLRPSGCRPTQIYAHQKRPFSWYKLWTYIQDFTVLSKGI